MEPSYTNLRGRRSVCFAGDAVDHGDVPSFDRLLGRRPLGCLAHFHRTFDQCTRLYANRLFLYRQWIGGMGASKEPFISGMDGLGFELQLIDLLSPNNGIRSLGDLDLDPAGGFLPATTGQCELDHTIKSLEQSSPRRILDRPSLFPILSPRFGHQQHRRSESPLCKLETYLARNRRSTSRIDRPEFSMDGLGDPCVDMRTTLRRLHGLSLDGCSHEASRNPACIHRLSILDHSALPAANAAS